MFFVLKPYYFYLTVQFPYKSKVHTSCVKNSEEISELNTFQVWKTTLSPTLLIGFWFQGYHCAFYTLHVQLQQRFLSCVRLYEHTLNMRPQYASSIWVFNMRSQYASSVCGLNMSLQYESSICVLKYVLNMRPQNSSSICVLNMRPQNSSSICVLEYVLKIVLIVRFHHHAVFLI